MNRSKMMRATGDQACWLKFTNQPPPRFDSNMRHAFKILLLLSLAICLPGIPDSIAETLNLGSRRELFIDDFLIASKTNVQLTLHEPRDEGSVLKFDAPWEGQFCAYVTV